MGTTVDTSKQQRIIQVALQEFVSHNYAQASTNAIVKEAGISKGLLFHYFQSKAGLYVYLVQHTLNLITEAVLAEVDITSGDVFEVMQRSTQVKMETARRFPLEVAFYTRALTDTSLPEEISTGITANTDAAFDIVAQLGDSLDASLLKDGLDKGMVARLTNWFVQGITREVIAKMDENTSLEYWQDRTNEIEDYFALMRGLFYKEVE